MEPVVAAYLTYLAITVPLAVWVAKTLHRHGQRFLIDVFDGDESMATSVNSLLVIGFVLLNLGFIALAMATQRDVDTGRELVELVSSKVGLAVLVLGGIHLANVWAFNTYRRRAVRRASGFHVVEPAAYTVTGRPAPPPPPRIP
jgi:hypothetical protein